MTIRETSGYYETITALVNQDFYCITV